MELSQQLDNISQLVITGQNKQAEEIKNLGTALTETKAANLQLRNELDALIAKQADVPNHTARKSFADELKENESVLKLARDGRGTAVVNFKGGLRELERKTSITTSAVGQATSGVMNYERDPGVEMQAMRQFTVRDLLSSSPTTSNAIDYVKVNAFTNAASPQVEASDKAEAALTFTTATANVRTIAHWIPATKQILDDFSGLQEVINTELIYGLKLKEEQQLLSGSGAGNDLNGLITQATSFTTSLLGSGVWHKADVIRRAKQQVESADQTPCTWVILNPVDWADIELAKDTARQYLSGYAGLLYTPMGPMLWGMRVVVTPSITSGTFLVGNSVKASIRDREDVTVEISTEHSDYFIKNMVAIRCEERLALVNRRPASFITGTMNTSPAS